VRVEVHSAEGNPLEGAPRQLAYKGAREMAAKALEYVTRNPGLKLLEN